MAKWIQKSGVLDLPGMAVMPTLAWEPGGPLTPHHPPPFIRLGDIRNPETDTPHHGHYQPRHLPRARAIVCFVSTTIDISTCTGTTGGMCMPICMGKPSS